MVVRVRVRVRVSLTYRDDGSLMVKVRVGGGGV